MSGEFIQVVKGMLSCAEKVLRLGELHRRGCNMDLQRKDRATYLENEVLASGVVVSGGFVLCGVYLAIVPFYHLLDW